MLRKFFVILGKIRTYQDYFISFDGAYSYFTKQKSFHGWSSESKFHFQYCSIDISRIIS